MKDIYIVNRFQLKDKYDVVRQKLKARSERLRRDFEIVVNDSPKAAVEAMKRIRKKKDIITAIGGDGSVNLLLNDLMGTDNVLSFIPFGTGNDFYRTCDETLEEGIHEVDVVRINDRYFINTCCFGIDADIANDDHFIHNRFIPRPLRYHAGVLYHFLSFKGGRHLTVTCDGETIEDDFMTVVAANGRYYGGGYKVSPDSRIDDGVMELYLVKKISRFKMAAMILSMKHAGHLKEPSLRMIRTKKAVISSAQPVKANIDGEPIVSDHFELELLPKGIRLDFHRTMK